MEEKIKNCLEKIANKKLKMITMELFDNLAYDLFSKRQFVNNYGAIEIATHLNKFHNLKEVMSPEFVLDNKYLAEMIDLLEEWILELAK